MSKYSDIASLVSSERVISVEEAERTLVRASSASVQVSLYARLRKGLGGSVAGRVAWLLIRSTQEAHADYEGATIALSEQPTEALETWLAAARASKAALQGPHAKRLAGEIVERLEAVLGVRRGRELAARRGQV